MNKNIVFNKYYRNLRQNIFSDLEIAEFMKVWSNFKRLQFQYRLLLVCNKLEKIKIPIIEVPIFRFFSKFLDFMRWKVFDILWLLINGRYFQPFGLTVFCRSSRWRKNYFYG